MTMEPETVITGCRSGAVEETLANGSLSLAERVCVCPVGQLENLLRDQIEKGYYHLSAWEKDAIYQYYRRLNYIGHELSKFFESTCVTNPKKVALGWAVKIMLAEGLKPPAAETYKSYVSPVQ